MVRPPTAVRPSSMSLEDRDADEAGEVTATVTAADGSETGGQVRFSVGGRSETVYLQGGASTATIPAGLADGEQTVTAEYLGFDILRASEVSETFQVLPAVSATVTIANRCAGGKVVLTVAVANDEGRKIDVRIETPYGAKPVGAIVAGKTHSSVFTTRAASIPAGDVTVTASAGEGDDRVQSIYEIPYGAVSCTP